MDSQDLVAALNNLSRTVYSPSIDKLIRAFKHLPSVGERTAERFVFSLLKSGKKEVTELVLALRELVENVKSCEVCWNFSDTNPCIICGNEKRDQNIICIVADPADMLVIERTGIFSGAYHILRGTLDMSDDQTFDKLKLSELFTRITKKPIKELLLALNPDMAGETTMLYIEKEIKQRFPAVKTTRLARGLPMGADLRYADEITLSSAIKNRATKQ